MGGLYPGDLASSTTTSIAKTLPSSPPKKKQLFPHWQAVYHPGTLSWAQGLSGVHSQVSPECLDSWGPMANPQVESLWHQTWGL